MTGPSEEDIEEGVREEVGYRYVPASENKSKNFLQAIYLSVNMHIHRIKKCSAMVHIS